MSDSEETKGRFPVPMPAKSDAAAPRKTVEEWATEKGFLPQTRPRKGPAVVTGGVRGVALAGNPVEHNPEFWKFAAARAGNRWVIGFEITEADFDKEIVAHTDLAHG